MSNEIRFDRRKGFVALPVEVLELELSPGAFRLLVELCRMANLDGFCWPSLGQLGERLGRSKAAISGYVQELRDAELVTTEEQRTANGYNYRLRYCVVFWKAWRASLTGRVSADQTGQESEGRVQRGERLKESKNQSLINHDQGDLGVLDGLTQSWAEAAKGAPYPALRFVPSERLVAETRAAVAAERPKNISADIEPALSRLWAALGLSEDDVAAKAAAQHLQKRGLSEEEIAAALRAIRKGWQPHWRRIPSPKQIDQLLKSAHIVSRSAQVKVLKSYLRRWEMVRKTAEKPLRQTSPCESLPVRAMAGPCPAPTTDIRGYN